MTGLAAQERKLPDLNFNGMGMQFFLLLGGTDSGQIVYRDVRDKGTQTFLNQAHSAPITSILANTSGKRVITSSTDGFIKIWSITYSECEAGDKHLKDVLSPSGRRIRLNLQPLSMLSLNHNLCEMIVYDDKRHLLGVTLKNKKIIGFSSRDGENSFQELPSHPDDDNHTGHISGMAYLESLGIFATCSYDGNVKVWDMNNNSLIRDVQFSEPLEAIEFASDRGDLIVSMNHQIVLIQVQDYLTDDYFTRLLQTNWIDDPIEDPDIFDINSGFWKKTRFNRRIVAEYPLLWNQLMQRLKINSWEQLRKKTPNSPDKPEKVDDTAKGSTPNLLEDSLPVALKYEIEIVDDDEGKEVDPTKVNVPDYEYRPTNSRPKTRIYDELAKDGPIVYNVPEMELEKILENAHKKPKIPEIEWKYESKEDLHGDSGENSSETSSNMELQRYSVVPPIEEGQKGMEIRDPNKMRQEVIEMLEYNKKKKEAELAKLEEEKKKAQLEKMAHSLDIPRPNAAGQQAPEMSLDFKRKSLQPALSQREGPPSMKKSKKNGSKIKKSTDGVTELGIIPNAGNFLSFSSHVPNNQIDEEEDLELEEWNPDEQETSNPVSSKQKKESKAKKKKELKRSKKVEVDSSIIDETDELEHIGNSFPKARKVSLRTVPVTTVQATQMIEYYRKPMILNPKISDPFQSFTDDKISFQDVILDRNSFFVKNFRSYEVPGVSVKARERIPVGARAQHQPFDFKAMFGEPKKVVRQRKVIKKVLKQPELIPNNDGSVQSLDLPPQQEEYEEIVEYEEYETYEGSELFSDDEYEEKRISLAEFDVATVAWSLFKAATLQNHAPEIPEIVEPPANDSVYRNDNSVEIKNPKYKPILPTAMYLEKLKNPHKKEPKGPVTLCIPDVKRMTDGGERGVDTLGMDLIDQFRKKSFMEDDLPLSDDSSVEEISFGFDTRRESMHPNAISKLSNSSRRPSVQPTNIPFAKTSTHKKSIVRKTSLASSLPTVNESADPSTVDGSSRNVDKQSSNLELSTELDVKSGREEIPEGKSDFSGNTNSAASLQSVTVAQDAQQVPTMESKYLNEGVHTEIEENVAEQEKHPTVTTVNMVNTSRSEISEPTTPANALDEEIVHLDSDLEQSNSNLSVPHKSKEQLNSRRHTPNSPALHGVANSKTSKIPNIQRIKQHGHGGSKTKLGTLLLKQKKTDEKLDEVLKSSSMLPRPKPMESNGTVEPISMESKKGSPPSKITELQGAPAIMAPNPAAQPNVGPGQARRVALSIPIRQKLPSEVTQSDWDNQKIVHEFVKMLENQAVETPILSTRTSVAVPRIQSKKATPLDATKTIHDNTVTVLKNAPWFPDFKGKAVNVHTVTEALLSVIKDNNVEEDGRVEASLCLRFLNDTFHSEMKELKGTILEAHLDALQHAPPPLKIQLLKTIGLLNISSESVVLNLICALNDPDNGVVRAAIDALGYVGIASKEELYYRMQSYNMLNEFKIENKTKFVHPLDVCQFNCRSCWLEYKSNSDSLLIAN
jgi:hypothetical protein